MTKKNSDIISSRIGNNNVSLIIIVEIHNSNRIWSRISSS